VADEATDYFAVHGYDQTGITPGFPDYSEWQDYYEAAASEPNPKEMWMTETAIGYEGWNSALNMAGAIHGSLWAGNVSWWTAYGFPGDYITDNVPNTSFYAAKSFYKFIRPGAVRLSTSSTNGDVMPTAFINKDSSTVIVIINKSTAAINTRINGNNFPDEYHHYRTSSREKFNSEGILKLSDGTFILPPSSITTLVATGYLKLTMNQTEDQVVDRNSGETAVEITGISNGKGSTEGLSLTFESSNEALFSNFALSAINIDGTASLTFEPAQDATGYSKISLYLTDGEETRIMTFFVIVPLVTGLEETERAVKIYPNPASDYLNIGIPEGAYQQIRIMDMTGRVILQKVDVTGQTVLDISSLRRGLYMVELSGAAKNKYTTLISKP
jgi:hypothetical protein